MAIDTPTSLGGDLSALLQGGDFGPSTSNLVSVPRPRRLGIGQPDVHRDKLGSRTLPQSSSYVYSSASPPPASPPLSSPPPSSPPSFLSPLRFRSSPPSPQPYSHPYQHQCPPPSPPLSFQLRPLPGEDVRNQQGYMTSFPASQASTSHHPGGSITPRVQQPSFSQYGTPGSSWISGNLDCLSLHNPASFPSYISGDGYYQRPSPAPSTSTGIRTGHSSDNTSTSVRILHIKA